MLPFVIGIGNCVAGVNAIGVEIAINELDEPAITDNEQTESITIAHKIITAVKGLHFIYCCSFVLHE
jgi:hypothetical protein